MADLWSWDRRARRYRNERTGRFISEAAATQLRDTFTTSRAGSLDALTREIMGAAVPGTDEWIRLLSTFERQAWRHIESTFAAQFMAGNGGWRQLDEGGRREMARLLGDQRRYFDRFIADARSGVVKSIDGLSYRARLYTSASTSFYERARATAWSINLPGYPGDGLTECGGNCRCSWDISERDNVVYARWRTNAGDICNDCADRGRRWNPYEIARTTT